MKRRQFKAGVKAMTKRKDPGKDLQARYMREKFKDTKD